MLSGSCISCAGKPRRVDVMLPRLQGLQCSNKGCKVKVSRTPKSLCVSLRATAHAALCPVVAEKNFRFETESIRAAELRWEGCPGRHSPECVPALASSWLLDGNSGGKPNRLNQCTEATRDGQKEKDARSRGRGRGRPACLLAMLDQGFSLSSGAQRSARRWRLRGRAPSDLDLAPGR